MARMRAVLDFTVALLPFLVSILGVVVSIKAPHPNLHSKWILGLVGCGVLFTFIIMAQQYSVRIDEMESRARSERNIDGLRSQIDALGFLVASKQSDPTAADATKVGGPVAAAINRGRKMLSTAPPESLKARALTLSGEGTLFIMERRAATPMVYVGSGKESDQSNAQMEYDRETQALWYKRFGVRYAEIHKDLVGANVHDELLDAFVGKDWLAGHSEAILGVMSRLSLVAEKLPDSKPPLSN